MSRWTDLAEWRGPVVNEGDGDGRPGEAEDRAVECRGLVLHIADGYYGGTISWQGNPDAEVSSHFVVAGPRDVAKGTADGKLAQTVDTDDRAWTQRDGNGRWLSIECSGFSGDALSAAQIEGCARILARGHQVYGYPLQLATSPAGRGLGHHSMGTAGRSVPTDTWTGATWGHETCPGPAIVAQKPAILARAIAIVSGSQEDDVVLTPDQAAALGLVGELAWRMDALYYDLPATRGGAYQGKPEGINRLHAGLASIAADLDALKAAVAALAAPAPGVLTEADLLAVQSSAQAGARAGVNGATAVIHVAP
ncbi:MAG: N-acetylmuramoyl-L-alanine amidase [Chloroflexota bacterium]